MTNLKITTLSVFVTIFSLYNCQTPDKVPQKQFWCWISAGQMTNVDSTMQALQSQGIDGILLSASIPRYQEIIPLATKYGIRVHAWSWIMNSTQKDTLKQHPEWLSVNRNGHSLSDSMAYVHYYKFMCPALPEVRNYIYNRMTQLCQIDDLEAISLDYHRYVDVILPEKLWDKYGITQHVEHPEWDYGYHPAMIAKFNKQHGYDPLEQEDPTLDSLWRQFRYDQISEIAREVQKIAHAHGKKLSASPFPTPTLAKRHVRQEWNTWNLDMAFPMVYNGFYAEEGPEWLHACVTENMNHPDLQQVEMYTGLYVPGHRDRDFDLKSAIDIAFANGSMGVALFDYRTLTDAEWKLIRDYPRN